MANDTLNENAPNEKSIHEHMVKIELRIMALREAIQNLCKHMVKGDEYKDKVCSIDGYISQLNDMQLQLNYIDGIIQDTKLQQQNEPLIIKEGQHESNDE